ncbi:MAG: GntR family transcriptional regulator, partial [Rhodospirillales bacterium]|nr:GntR family transcriptional regulator [Rhodospirillales bacterium]
MATAKEIAYELIRNSIFSGKFQPGHQLKEEELAGLLNVSRTPVREALRQLADQGLIEIRANRRSYVADVTEAQFEELMDILSFLESYSARRAARRISKEALDELKRINAEIEQAVDDDPQFLQLNSKFHRAIHRAAGSHKLYELIDRIIDFHHNLYFKF